MPSRKLGIFDDTKHSGISAVIYVETDIIDSLILPEDVGYYFTIVLNPHAKNPLPEELLTFGNVWRKEGKQIFNPTFRSFSKRDDRFSPKAGPKSATISR